MVALEIGWFCEKLDILTQFATLQRNHKNYIDTLFFSVGKSAVIKYHQLLSKIISIKGKWKSHFDQLAIAPSFNTPPLSRDKVNGHTRFGPTTFFLNTSHYMLKTLQVSKNRHPIQHFMVKISSMRGVMLTLVVSLSKCHVLRIMAKQRVNQPI